MKHKKIIDSIGSGTKSREDLLRFKKNAEDRLAEGDSGAVEVLDAINNAMPKDAYVLFMGFCPNADFSNRLDVEWKDKGICRFDYLESQHQVERFNTLYKGDLVVLKKREKFGETMKLYGHGCVKSVAYDDGLTRYLVMDWSSQDQVIEVPLMGCNSTVDIKSIDAVKGEMPDTYYKWLEV